VNVWYHIVAATLLLGLRAPAAQHKFRIETSRPTSLAFQRADDGTVRLEIAGGKEAVSLQIEGLIPQGSAAYEWTRGDEPIRKVQCSLKDGVFRMSAVPGKRYRIGPERTLLRPRVDVAAKDTLVRNGKSAIIACECRNPAPNPAAVVLKVDAPKGWTCEPPSPVRCQLGPKTSRVVELRLKPPSAHSAIGRRQYEVNLEATWANQSLLKTIVHFTTEDEPVKAPILVEAEAFAAQGGGKVQVSDKKAAASGGKAFLRWDAEGHWLEWPVVVRQDGNYHLILRYCTSFDGVRRAVSIDGQTPSGALASVAFVGTGGWANERNDWNHLLVPDMKGKPFVLALKKGTHTIRVTNVDGRGLNLDYIALMPAK